MSSTDDDAVTTAIASVEAQFGVMFNRMRASMRDRALRVHPEVQPGSYMILSTLDRRGPTHAGALAEILAMDKSIISRQAKQLEKLGLLVRAQDPDDRRATFLAASEDARVRLEAVRLSDQAALHTELGTWSVEDLDQLAGLLGRLNESL